MKARRMSKIWIEISLGFLLMLIPVVLLGYVSQSLVSASLQDQMLGASVTAIHQMTKNIDTIVDATQESYKQISVDKGFQSLMTTDFSHISEYQSLKKSREIDSLLSDHSSATSDISRIMLSLDNERFYIPHQEVQLLTGDKRQVIVNEDWFSQVLEKNGQLVWVGRHTAVDHLFDERGWDYAMSAVGKVRSYPIAKSYGIMIFDVRLSSLRAIFDGVNLGKGSEIHLLSPEGRDIMMNADDGEFLFEVSRKMVSNEIIETYDRMGRDQQSFYTDYRGASYLVVAEEIEDTGFVLVGLIPETSINEPVRKIKVWTVAIVFAAGFIVLFIGGYVVPRNISKRINVLIRKMIRVENGNLKIEETIDSTDEIGMIDRYFNRMVERLDLVIQDNYINKLDKREAELNALQFQINPHFLYNTLEIISGIAAVKGCDDIGQISENLGDMFRYSVGQEEGAFVAFSEELAHIKNYLNIQQVRLEDQLEVYYDISEEASRLKVIKFILQPIVENSIVHGLGDMKRPMTIEVAAHVASDTLVIEVSDNGVGINEEVLRTLKKSLDYEDNLIFKGNGSIGMKNVNTRIKMQCGEAYGMDIRSQEGEGTIIIYHLPIVRDSGDQ